MKEIFIDDQYVVISKDDYRMLKEEHALLTKQAAAKASVPENVTLKGGGRKVYYRYDDVLNLLKGGKLC